jgi:PAS domain S-box-containing protein
MTVERDVAEALIGSVADAILAVDRNGAITFWNPACERIFGFTAAEALGQSLDLIVPEPQRERHWAGFHQVMASGQSRYGAGDMLAVPALTKSGRISVEFTIVLLRDAEGRPAGVVSVFRDVSKAFDERRALRKRIAELGG